MTAVEMFLQRALALEGKPYVWGAKGPDAFDCSGLVTYCLWQVRSKPDWRLDHNADRIWKSCNMTDKPAPGDFLLYGPKTRASHIMVLAPDGRPYGAAGGNSSTLTPQIARVLGAKVQYRPTVWYRPDYLGAVKNPLSLASAMVA